MDYYSLDLQITKEPEGFLNQYRASILENGDIKATRVFELRRDLKLTQTLDRIEEKATISLPQPKETVHIEFGKMLYDTVFSGELGDYFNKSFNEALEEDCGLRVSLRISEDIPEIANLPWEYLHNGEEFLAVKGSILLSRLPVGVTKTKSQPIDSALHMLVIISSPDDQSISPLNTEKEQEIILEAVDKLYKEQKIKVDFTEDATLENIQGYLNDQDYHIVYFTGHGISIEGKGHLVFETEDRKAKLIDNKTIAELFSERGVRLIVLSSCESAKGSNKEAYGDIASMLLKQGIPAVVAMQYSVIEDMAINFAFNFYKAIANEDSIDLALEKARTAMKISEKSNGLDFATPVLYLSDYNSLLVKEIKPELAESENTPMMLSDLQLMKKGFVARKKELRDLERNFSSDIKQVAIIYGLGGIGKTALATRLALRMNEYFDGIFGMKCTSNMRPEDILTKMNIFLKIKGNKEFNQIIDQQIPLEEKTSLLIYILNQKRFLIIFDNFEDCLTEDRNDIGNPELKAFLIRLLSETISNTKFIITTRYDFDPLEGRLPESIEHISLPELQFPQANWLMNNCDKLANLSIRKKRQIYDVIGGHPWIIDQFAVLASSQRVEDLLMELEPLQKKLIEFSLMDKSYSKLDEKARRLLLCASIYEEAVPIEALSWIVGDEKDASPNVTEPLKKLFQWGLISKEKEHNQAVYLLHTIVKDFALKRLEEEELDKRKLLIRAANYYENLAAQSEDLWDLLKARDYYFQAEDWVKANIIVIDVSEQLAKWGYIELVINLLHESINTTFGLQNTEAEHELATVFCRLGDYNRALKICDNIKQKYIEIKDKSGIASAMNILGIIHYSQGNHEEAIKLYSQALEIQNELDNKEAVAALLTHLGIIYFDQGNNEEAIKLYSQALEIQKDMNDIYGFSMTLYELAMVHQSKSDYAEAIEFYNFSLEIHKELDNKSEIARILHQIGIIYCDQGDYEEAAVLYNQSLEIREKIGDKAGIAASLHELGIIHYIQHNYEFAIKFFTQSLKIKKEIDNKRGMGITLSQLGTIYCEQGDYEEAFRLSNQSLEIQKELKDNNGIASTIHNLGNIYLMKNDYQEAEKMYKQSLDIREKLGDKIGVSRTLYQLAQISHAQDNNEEALRFYKQSLEIQEKLGDKIGTASTMHQLGNIYYEQDNYEEALKMYTCSLKIKENVWDMDAASNICGNLGNIFYSQGRYEDAMKMYQRYIDIKEELGDKSAISNMYSQLAALHLLQEDYEESLKFYSESICIKKDLGDLEGIAEIYGQVGNIFEIQEQYSSALELYFKSFLVYEEAKSSDCQLALEQITELKAKMEEQEFKSVIEKLVKQCDP